MSGGAAAAFRYDRERRRLWINCPHVDLGELQPVVQQAIREALLPETLDAVICLMPAATVIVRGAHLDRWLAGAEFIRLSQNLACRRWQAWGRELDHDHRLG